MWIEENWKDILFYIAYLNFSKDGSYTVTLFLSQESY